jgi:PAS domain S-box-containing protein
VTSEISSKDLSSGSLPMRVLVVEDSDLDALLLEEEFLRADCSYVVKVVDTLQAVKTAFLDAEWDVVLSDFKVSGFDGFDVLDIVKRQAPDVPVILISGHIGEETVVRFLKQGGDNFLHKDSLARLMPMIERELSDAEMRKARNKAEAELKVTKKNLERLLEERVFELAQTHEALQLSEERLGRLASSSMLGLIFWRLDGTITGANDAFLQMVGYSREDLEAGLIQWAAMTPPEYAHLDAKALQDLLEFNEMSPFEKQYIRKDGTRLDILIGGAFLDASQESGIALCIDITEKKRSAEILHRSDARLREAQRIAKLGVWEWDIAQDQIYWSDELYRIYGLTPSTFDARYQNFLLRIHPDDREAMHQGVQQALEKGVAYENIEFRILRPDGEVRHILTSGEVTCDENGSPVRMAGTNLDITDLKRAEMALKKSQYRLSKAQELAGLGYWEWDIVNNVRQWSDEVFEMFGFEPCSVVPSQAFFINRIHPEDRASVEDLVQRCLSGQAAYKNFEYRVLWPNGEVHHLLSSGQVSRDAFGNPVMMAGVVLNITKVKRTELALKESEIRLREAQRIAKLGSWDWDVVADKLYWSDQHFLTFGFEPQAFVPSYERFMTCIHPDDRDSCEKATRLSLEEDVPYENIEFRIVRPDGEIRHILCFGELTRDEQGQPVRMVGTNFDITERRRAEESYKLLSSQQEALLNNISDFAFIKDADSRYLAVNEPYALLLQHNREEMLGQTDMAFWPESQALKFQADDRFVIRTGQRIVVEEKFILPDGGGLWVETIKSPIRNLEGKVVGTAGLARDITNRKEAETVMLRSHEELEHRVEERTRELQAANRTLQENERLRSTFVSSLTHDLRTPLIAQKRLIELLQDEFDESHLKAAFLARGLVQNNENLLDMVNKLLETYQYAEGGMTVHFEPVCLHDIVSVCHDTLREMAQGKNIAIFNEIHPDFAPLSGDPSLLKRVFMNLLGNAIDNISAGCEVRIRAVQAGEFVTVDVTDNGPGINPEFLPHMFDRYFPRARTPQKIGSGLGLFICKMIVELHGGTIVVASELGQGATFTIRLPKSISEADCIDTKQKRISVRRDLN